MKSNEKIKTTNDKSVLSKSTNISKNENPKTDRATTSKKLGVSKLKGISNSLILNNNDTKNAKNAKKENSIFLPNIKVTPNKLKRLEKDLKFKFSLDYICRDNSIKSKLKETCKNLFVDEFYKKIFSDDFKKQVIALKEMKEQMDKKLNIQIYFENLDLILKIYGINLNGNLNPTLVKNLIEFLDSLYNTIKENNKSLNEIELNIILTLLIDKLSINNNTLKEHLIKLLNEYIELTDINKTMIVVLNIALGKNSKIKTEILDFTNELFNKNKLDIIQRNYVKIFGKYICTNDNIVKSKVLILFKHIFPVVGEELFILLDFLTDKDKKFLESNLFIDNEEEFEDEEEEVEIVDKHYLEINSSDEEIDDNDIDTDNNNNNNNSNINKNNNITKVENGAVDSNKGLIILLKDLMSKNEKERNNAVILIHKNIIQNYEENKHLLIPNIDNIIKYLIIVTHELFIKSDLKNIDLKFSMYLSSFLIKIANNKELISHISFDTLNILIHELLNYLLINNFNKIGKNKEGDQIYKTINSTMLRIIENCDKNSVIFIFLEVLKNYQNENKNIVNLTVKCLLRATQDLDKIINGLNIGKILKEMNIIIYNFQKNYLDLQHANNQIESYIIKFIREFIYKIAKFKEDTIMEIYNNSVKISNVEDKYIINWIKAGLERNRNKYDKNLNFSSNIGNINNSNNNSINNNINNDDIVNKDKNNKQTKEDNKNEENSKNLEEKNKKVNIDNNTNNNKVNNTIDKKKKKWNDIKFK